jgi:hypothetical protein
MRFVFFFFQFYIGGVPNKQDGLLVMQNFTGCMENLYLNTTNVIYSIKEATSYGDNYLYEKVNTLYSCPVSNIPIFIVGYETCQKEIHIDHICTEDSSHVKCI